MTDKTIFKDMTYNTLNKQVDGDHYKSMKVEPAYFINENNLPYAEGNAIKYICRHKKKGKKKGYRKGYTLLGDDFRKRL